MPNPRSGTVKNVKASKPAASLAVLQQTPSPRVRKNPPKRTPGDGIGNGKGKVRTPLQLDRQERVFELSVMQGKTMRAIAAELDIACETVTLDLRCEQERRSDEIASRRDQEKARAVEFYQKIIAKALVKSELYDTLLAERAGAKISDHSLDAALKARERIDKVLGVDAPTKVELGIQSLLDAIGGSDDPQRPLQ